MKVGLFDHVEHAGRPLATLFDERLTFAKAAEDAGIYCLHVAEHHATPLNMVPVPGVYLGAVARATKRIELDERSLNAVLSRLANDCPNVDDLDGEARDHELRDLRQNRGLRRQRERHAVNASRCATAGNVTRT